MEISALSGFNPAISLISALNPTSSATSIGRLGGLLSLSSTQTSISDLGRLLGAADILQKTAGALAAPGAFAARTATPSKGDVLTATAGADTPTGTYTINVTQLAQAQVLTTAAQATSLANLGDGSPTTLTFQFASGVSRSVTLGSGDRSLDGIASAINTTDIGIKAAVQSSPGGYELTLTGQSGAANAFNINVTGDTTLADLLGYPPTGGAPTLTRQAQDAEGLVNGTAFTASTNAVNTAVPGLALNLQATGASTLTVTPNTSQTQKVNVFVAAYNDVQTGLTRLSRDNPILGLNATYLRNQLADTLDIGTNTTGNPGITLAQIGITTNSNGTLSFDTQKFQAALNANPGSIANLFSNGGQGIAEQVGSLASGPLSPPNLSLTGASALGLTSSFTPLYPYSELSALLGTDNGLGNAGISSSFADQFLLAGLTNAGSSTNSSTTSSLLDSLISQSLTFSQSLTSLSTQLELTNLL